jgi:hypothetical protein
MQGMPMGWRRSFLARLFPLLLAFGIARAALGAPPEDPPGSPLAGTPPVEPQRTTAPAHSVHPFWDRKNVVLFSGIGLFRGLDYASTRNMQARGREEILLPDDVVNNSAGFASLEAAGTVTSIGISYIFHRTGHHKLERWMSIVHIGVTGFGVARNYALESKHPTK